VLLAAPSSEEDDEPEDSTDAIANLHVGATGTDPCGSALAVPEREPIQPGLPGTPEEIAAVGQLVATGQLGPGPWQHLAARRFADTFKVPYVVLTANGNVCITLALKALGVREGDLVYVPALASQTTVGGCYEMKVVPVLAEVLADNLTIDPAWVRADLERRRRAGESLPKVIVAAALDAQVPDMPALREIANESGMFLILDFADGPYGEIAGRPVTSWADVITYSFNQSTPLPIGDGGAIACHSPWRLAVLQMLVSRGYTPSDLPGVESAGHGMSPHGIELPDPVNPMQSIDRRMTDMQACLLYQRIPRLIEMQATAAHTIWLLGRVIREFPFITPFTPVACVTVPCFTKWGFAVDPEYMPIDSFLAALLEGTLYEWTFCHPALGLGEERNPLRPQAPSWITDRHYLDQVADPARHPIAAGARSRVVLVEWPFLLLGGVAADLLRAALSKIARDRKATTTTA
jgi:dTDP-4-amino-4,6-dideoxygalactose transaminase